MVQRCRRPCFLSEALQPVGIGRERRRQYLDGYVASEPRIAGPVDFAHAAGANLRGDFIRTNFLSCRYGHGRAL